MKRVEVHDGKDDIAAIDARLAVGRSDTDYPWGGNADRNWRAMLDFMAGTVDVGYGTGDAVRCCKIPMPNLVLL